MPQGIRVQAPQNPDYTPLEVAGTPGSTFVQVGDNPLLRLSTALGEVNPALANFGAAYIEKQQKKASDEAVTKVPLMTNEAVHQAYQAGKLPGMDAPDSIADITSRKLYGARQADVVQNAIKEDLAKGNFDWEKGNINDYVRGHMANAAKSFENDPMALKGFVTSMDGFPEKMAALRTKQATEIDQARRQDNTFQAISLSVDKAIEAGASSEDVFKAARSAQVATSGPRGSQGVPFADSDKFVIQKAAQMVSEGKNLDAAVSLLTSERTGDDGTKLPALKDTASHQEQIKTILHQAVVMRQKQAVQAFKENVTTQDANTILSEKTKLIAPPDITLPADETGKSQTITSDQRLKAATTNYIQVLSPSVARANRETPTQTFDRELSNLANSGIEHPVWKATLDAAPKGASLNEMTNPAKLQQLTSAANLYDNLREKNPLYLQSITESKTRDFFELYRVAKTMPNTTMQQALDNARRASIDISPEREDTLKGHYREIEQAVASASPTSGFFQSIFGSVPSNSGYVQQQVLQKAKMYARLDLSPQAAIEAAKKQVKETSSLVGNWVIPNLNTPLPKAFPEAADSYIEDFVKKYGKQNGDIGKGDVGIAYNGAGAFTLVGPNGAGLTTPTGMAQFTMKDLSGHLDRKADLKRQEILDSSNKKKSTPFDDSPNAPHMLLRNGISKLIGQFKDHSATLERMQNYDVAQP